MEKKYRVRLTGEEQAELRGLAVAAYKFTPGSCCSDESQPEGARRNTTGAPSCVEEGLESALSQRAARKSCQGEEHLIALACAAVGHCNCWLISWWSGR